MPHLNSQQTKASYSANTTYITHNTTCISHIPASGGSPLSVLTVPVRGDIYGHNDRLWFKGAPMELLVQTVLTAGPGGGVPCVCGGGGAGVRVRSGPLEAGVPKAGDTDQQTGVQTRRL